jgi:hypothetical protein
MRSALTLGRTCLKAHCPIPNPQSQSQSRYLSLPTSRILSQCRKNCTRGLESTPKGIYKHEGAGYSQRAQSRDGRWQSWGWRWRAPPRRRGLLLAAATCLSPAAFLRLSSIDNDGTNETAEGRMLAASRSELKDAKTVSDDTHGFSRFKDTVILFIDMYIWEPLCTGTRFLHLVFIFVPVIVSVPAIWIGKRVKERDGERTGCLWWYGFLVRGMERAGPAFIKVNIFLLELENRADIESMLMFRIVGTMGRLKIRHFPHRDV